MGVGSHKLIICGKPHAESVRVYEDNNGWLVAKTGEQVLERINPHYFLGGIREAKKRMNFRIEELLKEGELQICADLEDD
jgi:hypothetical protein